MDQCLWVDYFLWEARAVGGAVGWRLKQQRPTVVQAFLSPSVLFCYKFD